MYQLTTTSSIVRLADGAIIPADQGNADYRSYLAWVAAGNTPAAAPAPVRDIPAEQLALLDAYTAVELRNITPAGAVRLAQWAAAGNVKAQAVAAWIESHWAEYRAKQAALDNFEVVSLVPANPWKPYSYAEIAAEA